MFFLKKFSLSFHVRLDTQGQLSILLMSIMIQGISLLKELSLCSQMILQRNLLQGFSKR